MKHIIFLLLFLPFIGFSQGGTWPVKYNDSDPSGAPSAAGTRLYFNTATNTLFFWEPAPSSTWRKQPKSFDQITGCAAPAYTPTARQSTFAVNSCTPKPELYQWTGSAWALLNPETLYTEGTGIDITGGVITNTAPNVVQTLSIAGQDLTLSGGGGTVEIPAGVSDALGSGFASGGGSGTIPDGTSATLSSGGSFGTREVRMLFGVPSWIQSQGDNFPEFGLEDYDPDNEVAAFFGYSSEQAGLFSFGAFDLPNNRNAGFAARPGFITIGASNSLTITSPVSEFYGVTRIGRFTTAQRAAISSPATGYIIFCTDATATDSSTGVMQVWNGSVWKNAW
jgi:hypothetical protein